MNNFLYDLAIAHQRHEGWFPGSRSWRNNNPGNLRAGAPYDGGKFTIYPSYSAGFAALQADLYAKITGGSRHIDYSKDPTFLTYVRVYAPADDGNSPTGYCQSLCKQLAKYNVKPNTPLTALAALVNQMIDRIPDPVRGVSLEQQLVNAQVAYERARGLRKNAIGRLIERIKKALSTP